MDFTIVIGVDAKHLDQAALTWPTIQRYKPSLLTRPRLVFYNAVNLSKSGRKAVEGEISRILSPSDIVPWDTTYIDYGTGTSKWDNPHRHRMLAGFLYASRHVKTPYWLKLDTDAIATGVDDWIQPDWFKWSPAIVGPPWSYTKPPDQMLKLDQWVAEHRLFSSPPLNLVPAAGASRLVHQRVAGWCNFFDTQMTQYCAEACERTVGAGKMAVPSLDGLLWYYAMRSDLPVVRVNMKRYGWDVRNSMSGIRDAVESVMLQP